MSAPKVLDLFSGAGGSAVGYARAWPDADITGVDLVGQPRYPFRHVVADAMTYPLDGVDFVHASPPCQRYSRTRHIAGRDMGGYARLIGPLRERLRAWGGPWVMEGVAARDFGHGTTLCGLSFGLRVFRHRTFEGSMLLLGPPHLRHAEPIRSTTRGSTLAYYTREVGAMTCVVGHLFSLAAGSHAMGIDWMTKGELAEAIPPAYTEFLARQYGPLARRLETP